MVKVKARFIGTNSLGFINNIIYNIVLIDRKISDVGNPDNRIYRIEPIDTNCVDAPQACEYGSWTSFLRNWELLTFLGGTDQNLTSKTLEYLRERKINKVLNG